MIHIVALQSPLKEFPLISTVTTVTSVDNWLSWWAVCTFCLFSTNVSGSVSSLKMSFTEWSLMVILHHPASM